MCGQVVSEPVIKDASESSDALIADLGWEPQTMVLFDIHVIDTDVRSYTSMTPLELFWLQLKLIKRENTVMPVLSAKPHLHLCVFQWMVLPVMRLPVF